MIASALGSVSKHLKAEEPGAEKPATDVTPFVPSIECYKNADFIERTKKIGLDPVMVGRNVSAKGSDGMTVLWMGTAGFVFSYTKDGSDQTCALGNLISPAIDPRLLERLNRKGA